MAVGVAQDGIGDVAGWFWFAAVLFEAADCFVAVLDSIWVDENVAHEF